MKFKKITSVFLSAVLGSVIIFSGCANGGNDESSVFSKNEQSNISSSSQSSKTEQSKAISSQASSSKNESSQNQISTDPDYTPAMWKVTKGDKELYLFGSIHATDDSAENLPAYVQDAFDKCDSLAVEINMDEVMNDFSQAYSLMTDLVYADGTTIKDHISKETYDAAVKYLTENGLYSTYYDSFKPMMWISLLENSICQNAGIDTNNSMETIMSSKAKAAGKEILEVESIEIQLAVFDEISDKFADYMIKSYTEDGAAEVMKKSTANLYELWKKGQPLPTDNNIEEIPDELKDDYEKYNKAMLTNRNIGMADKAEEYMNDGKKVFFMVGAAHMYGDDGIVSLLKQRGYTVDKVNPDAAASDNNETTSQTESKAA